LGNRHGGGAMLLEYPDVLNRIVSTVRKAVPIHMPVTAKMRLAFNDDSRAEECAQALALHGKFAPMMAKKCPALNGWRFRHCCMNSGS
jgi:tRNA-dihydrouridine synthase